jgi:hypothetical protein
MHNTLPPKLIEVNPRRYHPYHNSSYKQVKGLVIPNPNMQLQKQVETTLDNTAGQNNIGICNS